MLLAAPVYAEVLLEDMIHIFPSFIYFELSYKMFLCLYSNSEGTIIAMISCLSISALTLCVTILFNTFDDDFYVY